MFYEACEQGRHSREINRNVFEKIIALDDFLTFKKIMVKRNMERELETIRSFRNIGGQDLSAGADDEDFEAALRASLTTPLAPLPNADEIEEMGESRREEVEGAGPMSEEEVLLES